ncbi:MAG: type II toxin-antitoxin system prevent-host-death family antitoxin [Treponema sp.]|nr:type II toxin-antitoxin system prevent-host-death family antitoxin [Spirochaetia bacterium]MDD7533687.1 type II toxin-antitoxin system prevent-host-death family antitoxin [Treponema sp.]MDY3721910.1 type II toxin-antitoxin system prevent-host-death family antitoxin [Treponema sp.]MDY5758414.1 type II toxin-antitoxin system prevent-host-death family antitoxin [Treponema sp.]MDY5817841.1 type II toxin-antitoxin system prevent-host-death family antitoxin [Treponema sp.]
MTAPLFDIKSKFSEYVTLAENGDVVEITKHGKTTAVIIGLKEYSELKKNYRPSFIDKVNEWKHKTGGLTQTEYNEYQNMLRRNKECYSKGESLF